MSEWMSTLTYLEAHPDGVTWEEAADHFGISRAGWKERRRSLRNMLATMPELGLAVPRATAENGWRYRLTNQIYQVGKADIRDGHIDDVKHVLGFLHRLDAENDVAYDEVVASGGRRSARAKKIKERMGAINSMTKILNDDLGVLGGLNGGAS